MSNASQKDPITVFEESSTLIHFFLSEYCKTGSADSLPDDAMGSVVQVFRTVYENRYREVWRVDVPTGIAGSY